MTTLEKLKADYWEAWHAWERLELPFFNKDYSEDYDDTIERLYLHGRYEALSEAIELLGGKL